MSAVRQSGTTSLREPAVNARCVGNLLRSHVTKGSRIWNLIMLGVSQMEALITQGGSVEFVQTVTEKSTMGGKGRR